MHNGDWFEDFMNAVIAGAKKLGETEKPKFKVGDAVRVKAKAVHARGYCFPPVYQIGKKMVIDADQDISVAIKGDVLWVAKEYLEPWNDSEEWDGSKWVAKKPAPCDTLQFKPAIVINRTNGVLKPATTPFVHPSAIEAEVEAKRLAELVKGEEFVVFEEVGSRRVEKSKAEVAAEVFTEGNGRPQRLTLDDEFFAEVEHVESSATGNIVTVKYHLKP